MMLSNPTLLNTLKHNVRKTFPQSHELRKKNGKILSIRTISNDLWNSNLGPQKKFLVLCPGGLLVHSVHVRDKATVRGLRPDVVHGEFLERPFCTEFLKFCLERFEVGLWSSSTDHNIGAVLSNITGGMKSEFLFVWGQDKCTDSGFGCRCKKQLPWSLIELEDLSEKIYFNEKYSALNTMLIDVMPHRVYHNLPAIFPHPNDTFLGPNGELCKFLDGLAVANDVPSYVKDHFGHAALLTMPDKCTLHQVHFCTACGILTHGPTFFGNRVSIKMPPCPPAQMHRV